MRFNTNAGRDGADRYSTWNKAVGFLKNQLKIMFTTSPISGSLFNEVLTSVAKVLRLFFFFNYFLDFIRAAEEDKLFWI